MGLLLKSDRSSIDSKSLMAVSKFSNMILDYINSYYDDDYNDIVIVCIGTDRSTGDALGPLVGHKLNSILKRYPDIYVIGTLENPVHAKNLNEKINYIEDNHDSPFIIAIDACLGKQDRIGFISIGKGPLKPGAGVNKDLPQVGHIHITGVVNLGGFMEYVILQNTRLSTVMNMADIISRSFNTAFWKYYKSNNHVRIKI
ncbi:spore protease YyaC [Dethiothermospora halolimnae]|uniref:spore protease YyaC n=1 Tax=Dethiothermospora halolimnae TaxID=3114390 RepID=UPI003CCBE802